MFQNCVNEFSILNIPKNFDNFLDTVFFIQAATFSQTNRFVSSNLFFLFKASNREHLRKNHLVHTSHTNYYLPIRLNRINHLRPTNTPPTIIDNRNFILLCFSFRHGEILYRVHVILHLPDPCEGVIKAGSVLVFRGICITLVDGKTPLGYYTQYVCCSLSLFALVR